MSQEFVVNSTVLEDKINQLLPSQAGAGAGVDLSASSMVVPIIDLTETAEGSEVRADLQTAFSHNTITAYAGANATQTIITTTGYFRVFGTANFNSSASSISFTLSDGATNKVVVTFDNKGAFSIQSYDFIVFISAGDSLLVSSNNAGAAFRGNTRQIADITGNLIDP